MRPLPEQEGSLLHALTLQGGKEFDLAAGRLQSRDGQRLLRLGAVELVGLGQQHQQLQAVLDARADHFQQDVVQLGETMPRVAQHHHARQVGPRDQVVGHDLLPAQLVLLGHGRIAVAGQVRQHRVGHALFAQGEQVDGLGAAGCLGGEGQPVLLRQGVDAGGLARIGPADEGDLGHAVLGQVLQARSGGEEAGGVQPAQGLCAGRCGGGARARGRRHRAAL